VKRPFVTANFAITADGRISTRELTPANFSSKRDKRRLLEIRAGCDAVLAGAKTIATDHMTMGLPAADLRAARLAQGRSAYPLRVLVSNRGQLSPTLPVFAKHFSPILIFTTARMSPARRTALLSHAGLYVFPERVDLAVMLATLRAEHGVRRLVCEGGGQLLRALLAADLIDELHLTVTPRVFGGKTALTLTGLAGSYLTKSTRLKLVEFQPVEDECFLRYRVA
jgi:riboflavin-specific deaminase-like protein